MNKGKKTGLTMRAKSSLAWAAAGVHKGQALTASSGDKPYKVPDRAEDRRACDQEAVPGTKHQRQGACQKGEVREITEKEQPTACGRPDEERIDRTFVTRKKGEAGREAGHTGAGSTLLRARGNQKKPQTTDTCFSVTSRDLLLGQAPSESIRF